MDDIVKIMLKNVKKKKKYLEMIEENEDTEYVDDTLLKYINILEKMRK